MSYNDYDTGDGELFDFDGDGDLDSFELVEMMNEQDREMKTMFHKDTVISSDDDDFFWDDPELAELGIDPFYVPQYSENNAPQKKNYSSSNGGEPNRYLYTTKSGERLATVIARYLFYLVCVIHAAIDTMIIIDSNGIPSYMGAGLIFGIIGYIVVICLLVKLIKNWMRE